MIHRKVKKWYIDNLRLMKRTKRLGDIYYDEKEFSWIILTKFRLPKIFNKSHSALLIDTPENNIEDYTAYIFYLDNELERKDGKGCNHLIDIHRNNRHHYTEWTMLSFHLNSFSPSFKTEQGDTYLDLCQSVYNFLGANWSRF